MQKKKQTAEKYIKSKTIMRQRTVSVISLKDMQLTAA